jgi:hypothetical protein
MANTDQASDLRTQCVDLDKQTGLIRRGVSTRPIKYSCLLDALRLIEKWPGRVEFRELLDETVLIHETVTGTKIWGFCTGMGQHEQLSTFWITWIEDTLGLKLPVINRHSPLHP